jgi:hypothetical protein
VKRRGRSTRRLNERMLSLSSSDGGGGGLTQSGDSVQSLPDDAMDDELLDEHFSADYGTALGARAPMRW